MAAKPITCQLVDSDGNPYSGAKLNVYDAGTTTPRAIYTESSLSTASANPAIADSNGVTVVWVDDAAGDIKIIATNSAESATPHSADNIPIDALTFYPVFTFQGDQTLNTTSSPTFASITLGAVPFSGVVTDPGVDRLMFWDDSDTQVEWLSLGTGLAITGNTLSLDGDLEDISGLTPSDGAVIIGNGSEFVTESGATARTSLGVAIGSDVLAYDANLQAFVGAFTAPTVDGTAGQFLTTDGAGVLTFATPAGGGDTLAAANETITGDWGFYKTIHSGDEIAIASGAITASRTLIRLQPEAGTSDDLATINGGTDGMEVLLCAQDAADSITIKSGSGNIDLGGGDIELDATREYLRLVYDGGSSKWVLSQYNPQKEQRYFYARDYVADPQERAYIAARDAASQDEAVVGAAIQSCENAALDYLRAGGNRAAVVVYDGVFATDRPMHDDTHIENLWTFSATGYSSLNEIHYLFTPGSRIQAQNWANATAVISAGWYSDESVTDAVPAAMFRWEQGAKWQFLRSRTNMELWGEADVDTDPVGERLRNINSLRDINLRVERFAQGASWVEDINNSSSYDPEYSRSGCQITNAGGDGFIDSDAYYEITASGGGTTTVTLRDSDGSAYSGAWEFTASHVGRYLVLEGAGTSNDAFVANIQSRSSATVVVLDAEAPTTPGTVERLSFGPLTISTTSNSASATVPTDLNFSLVGRYVGIEGAGSKIYTECDVLVTRVTAHNTTTGAITLATQAANTVSDGVCITMPQIYQGKSDDQSSGGSAVTGNNNDCQIFGQRSEQGSIGYSALSALYQFTYGNQWLGSKWHGINHEVPNFAGNFGAIWWDNAKWAMLTDSEITWGDTSPDLAKLIHTGARCAITYKDAQLVNSLACSATAVIYDNPQTQGFENFKIQVSGHVNRAAFPEDDQALVRHGTRGDDEHIYSNLGVTYRNQNTMGPVPARAGIFESLGDDPGFRWRKLDNTVNDVFDTGTYTPTLEFGGTEISTSAGTYSDQTGFYYRIGRMVYVRINITLTAKGSATGSATITLPSGLPPKEFGDGLSVTWFTNMATLYSIPFARTAGGAFDEIQLRQMNSGSTSYTDITHGNMTDTTRIALSGWYEVVI